MHKMKKILLSFALLILAAGLCACGAASITKPIPDESAEIVKIDASCTMTRVGDKLKVSVSTNLMDGAVMKVTIDSYNGDQLAAKYYTKAGDNFYVEFDIDPKWSGAVFGTMVCEPHMNGEHTTEIYDKYGKRFQNIAGEHILYNMSEGNYLAVQSEEVEL